jgi:hypothetical protein
VNRIVIQSRVDRNGLLQVTLPIGRDGADQEVTITIEPLVIASRSQDEWQRGIRETAGQWQGDFERPDQGDYEPRDSLS